MDSKIILYHGTLNRSRVLQEGLIPNKFQRFDESLEGYVYLSPDESFAALFGDVVKVKLPPGVGLLYDPDAPEHLAYLYPGPVPPMYLEPHGGGGGVVETVPEGEPFPRTENPIDPSAPNVERIKAEAVGYPKT